MLKVHVILHHYDIIYRDVHDFFYSEWAHLLMLSNIIGIFGSGKLQFVHQYLELLHR